VSVVKKVLKGLGLLLVLVLLCAGSAFFVGNQRLNSTHDGVGHGLVLPTDSLSLSTGERLTHALGCRDCHAEDLGGDMLVDDAAFATLPAPNLTSGEGGVGGVYSIEDWERSIRHGVGPDGRTLVIMPSESYAKFGDRDIAEIVAYLLTVPPVDRTHPEPSFGPMARVAALMAASEIVPATTLEHDAPHPEAVDRGPTAEFGGYLAGGCVGCHGKDYSGLPAGMGVPLPAANLTPHPATGLGNWTSDDFHRALTTGVRPDGTEIDPTAMPWPSFAYLTRDEVEAIWLFLQAQEPVEADRTEP